MINQRDIIRLVELTRHLLDIMQKDGGHSLEPDVLADMEDGPGDYGEPVNTMLALIEALKPFEHIGGEHDATPF